LKQVPEEHFDDLIAFFQFCYSLRDWLEAADPNFKPKIRSRISQSDTMRICRDICNRTKHYKIKDPSVDPQWSIGREYVPPDTLGLRPGLTETWFLIAGTKKLDVFELARECFEFWKGFVTSDAAPNNLQL
jgi:hypothetical protein